MKGCKRPRSSRSQTPGADACPTVHPQVWVRGLQRSAQHLPSRRSFNNAGPGDLEGVPAPQEQMADTPGLDTNTTVHWPPKGHAGAIMSLDS